ncbi:hypothetical protein [Sorangium sp. So ce124]|uniref:hypothetical protein n=1 Tax=Sorangium sp. So ce124 TaxID=3133280 RepID=UPI003F5FBFCE
MLPTDIVEMSRILTQRHKDAKTPKGGKRMFEDEIARVVIDAAIEAQRTLGDPGLLETVYNEALGFELE